MTKTFKIEYLKTALADLDDIFNYILRDNPQVAANVLDQIDSSISKLATFPEMAPWPKDDRLKVQGYRTLFVNNYVVYYVVLRNIVEIHRVRHGKQNSINLL